MRQPQFTILSRRQFQPSEKDNIIVDFSSSDEEEDSNENEEKENQNQLQAFNDSMMKQLVSQVLNDLGKSDNCNSFGAVLNNFDQLSAAITSVSQQQNQPEREKSISINLKNISDRQLETIKYIFKSLTKFELEFEVE